MKYVLYWYFCRFSINLILYFGMFMLYSLYESTKGIKLMTKVGKVCELKFYHFADTKLSSMILGQFRVFDYSRLFYKAPMYFD